MINEVILLYGREKRHEEALIQLLNLGYYEWAEKYCCEYTDNLLTKLFKKVFLLLKLSIKSYIFFWKENIRKDQQISKHHMLLIKLK